MTDDAELYRKAYERERAARLAAEEIVESKTRELFRKNQELEASLSQLQAQQRVLIQNEKMATLGVLAAGIAHEINNPMAFVYANLEVLSRYGSAFEEMYQLFSCYPDASDAERSELNQRTRELIEHRDLKFIIEELPEMLTDTREGIERVREIVLNLRNFSRSQKNEREYADLVAGLRSTLKILGSHLRSAVSLELDLQPLPPIYCNGNEMNQVFLNLLVNAIHAAEGRTDARIACRTWSMDKEVIIEIEDNGPGIPQALRDRVFDPFFTTKPPGKGTGMGLAIVHGIINDQGGRIELETSDAKGTRFRIHLPILDDSERPDTD